MKAIVGKLSESEKDAAVGKLLDGRYVIITKSNGQVIRQQLNSNTIDIDDSVFQDAVKATLGPNCWLVGAANNNSTIRELELFANTTANIFPYAVEKITMPVDTFVIEASQCQQYVSYLTDIYFTDANMHQIMYSLCISDHGGLCPLGYTITPAYGDNRAITVHDMYGNSSKVYIIGEEEPSIDGNYEKIRTNKVKSFIVRNTDIQNPQGEFPLYYVDDNYYHTMEPKFQSFFNKHYNDDYIEVTVYDSQCINSINTTANTYIFQTWIDLDSSADGCFWSDNIDTVYFNNNLIDELIRNISRLGIGVNQYGMLYQVICYCSDGIVTVNGGMGESSDGGTSGKLPNNGLTLIGRSQSDYNNLVLAGCSVAAAEERGGASIYHGILYYFYDGDGAEKISKMDIYQEKSLMIGRDMLERMASDAYQFSNFNIMYNFYASDSYLVDNYVFNIISDIHINVKYEALYYITSMGYALDFMIYLDDMQNGHPTKYYFNRITVSDLRELITMGYITGLGISYSSAEGMQTFTAICYCSDGVVLINGEDSGSSSSSN